MCANRLACDVAKANIVVLFNVHILLGFSCPYLDYSISLSKWFILKTFIHCGFCRGCEINTRWDFLYGVITMQPISHSRMMPLLFSTTWSTFGMKLYHYCELGILLSLTLCCVFHGGTKLVWLHIDDLQTLQMDPFSPTLCGNNIWKLWRYNVLK
jgi:hypothetical protein